MLKKSSFFNLSSRICLNPSYQLPDLTSLDGLETIEVFKTLAAANRSLAEMKGGAAAMRNQGILIDTLALQEAKASSEIENVEEIDCSNRYSDWIGVSRIGLYAHRP
ncbi:Fic/DOC family N-terminal domain-containing protein [Rhizobium sp. No.120]